MATTSTNKDLKRALNQARHKFSIMDDELSAANKKITLEVADELVSEIVNNYGSFLSSLSHDHQDRSDTAIYYEEEDEGYKIIVEGSQVIYDEFGTGDMGLMSGAEAQAYKSEYPNLFPYNSGPFIREDRNGNNYWVYYSNKDKRTVASFGVPAGMFMYHSFMNVADNIANNIEAEELLKAAENICKGK